MQVAMHSYLVAMHGYLYVFIYHALFTDSYIIAFFTDDVHF